ncbi:MAG TPA: FAD-dependent oxidoreductase, partial [Planctomycetia bacterium]|nr:FAD-dependent oxidoreductase [Planctomycetia bacterium]
MAAALALGERGVRVTLLESRPRLGGRATSFTDAGSGEEIDNCQHVGLGCCTNWLDFCARAGIDGLVASDPEIRFLDEAGRES